MPRKNLKIEKSQYRFYIGIRQSQGADARTIWEELITYASHQAPSHTTVKLWFRKLRGGQKSLEDKTRQGRPITKTSPDNIEAVRHLVEEDPHITYDEIEAETSLSRGSIHTILHEHLKLRKITSRWVPHELTEKNKVDRVTICKQNLAKFKENKWRLCDVLTGDESWFYLRQIANKQQNKSWVAAGESARTVVKRGIFEPKFMFTVFFKRSGVLHISKLDRGKTINHQSYIDDTLKPLIEGIKKQRPEYGCKNLKIHHDNARPHIHQDVVTLLEAEKFTIMGHPPYSPDLAPCDFWLFSYIKERLGDHTTAESLQSEITEIVACIPRKEWERTFDKWLERMELCIKFKGDYFEHKYNKN